MKLHIRFHGKKKNTPLISSHKALKEKKKLFLYIFFLVLSCFVLPVTRKHSQIHFNNDEICLSVLNLQNSDSVIDLFVKFGPRPPPKKKSFCHYKL